MNKIKIPKLEASTFKGWAFVLVAGVVLAVLALIDRGSLDEVCQLEVAAEEVNVRSGPSPDAALVRTLSRGEKVDGTNVVTGQFRKLADGEWAASAFLTSPPGTSCG